MSGILATLQGNRYGLVLVFCRQAGARLQYILSEAAGRIGISFRSTLSRGEFDAHPGPKISYGEALPGALFIPDHGLLQETGIRETGAQVTDDLLWKKIFFAAGQGEVPFDLFSAAFYLLSRYEEYLPHESDVHGRYKPGQSIAYRNHFLQYPLADHWFMQLGQLLRQQFPGMEVPEKKCTFLSTIDIDFAYRYNGIGLKRQVMKWSRSVLQLRWDDALEQMLVMTGLRKDPYDTYHIIHKHTGQQRLPLQYFMLMRSGTVHDKNIFPQHPLMQSLLKKLAASHPVGLHPSYYAGAAELQQEKALLEKYVHVPVTHTRQHFLRFTLPATYQRLLQAGFTDDYSMGYSSVCGFRASTCLPFRFFDLEKNEATQLTIHPLAVMDVTLKNQQRFTPEQAMQHIEQLMNEVKKVNGTFISLWHNSSLCEDREWKGWREVFGKMHTLASVNSRHID